MVNDTAIIGADAAEAQRRREGLVLVEDENGSRYWRECFIEGMPPRPILPGWLVAVTPTPAEIEQRPAS